MIIFPGRQKGHPACKKVGVGLFVGTIWLELCTSYSSSFYSLTATTTMVVILSCNKIQNGDILVPSYLSCLGKWPLE